MTEGTVPCPVCSNESGYSAPAPGWGQWRKCSVCELEFVQPMRLTESPVTIYGGAYRGLRKENVMEEFERRVRQREATMKQPNLWFWTPAFGQVFDWLAERLPNGGTVLEIGCGLGFVLHELRSRGFAAIGLDVAELPVELNRKDGFRVWHGPLSTMPQDWMGEPDAVIAFFMLHHLEDPTGLFAEIRTRWPRALLALAQYGPSNRDPERSAPPRTLTRWSARSLGTALDRAGYSAAVASIASTGAERPVFRPIRSLLKQTVVIPGVFRFARRIERRIVPKIMERFAAEEYVVMALAEPAATDGISRSRVPAASAAG